MADLLRRGATLTSMSCPSCSSPIFRLKDGDLRCAQCEKKVIVVNNEYSEEHNSITTLKNLENVLLNKIKEIKLKIEKSKDLEELEKLNQSVSYILINLEKIKNLLK
jgi:UPF0148 protein